MDEISLAIFVAGQIDKLRKFEKWWAAEAARSGSATEYPGKMTPADWAEQFEAWESIENG